MNQTALLAILVTKGIITKDEGEKIVEFLNNRPQSTFLSDAITQIEEFVDREVPAIKNAATQVKRTVTKGVNEAKKVANEIASDAVDTAETIAHEIAEAATQAGEKTTTTETDKK